MIPPVQADRVVTTTIRPAVFAVSVLMARVEPALKPYLMRGVIRGHQRSSEVISGNHCVEAIPPEPQDKSAKHLHAIRGVIRESKDKGAEHLQHVRMAGHRYGLIRGN